MIKIYSEKLLHKAIDDAVEQWADDAAPLIWEQAVQAERARIKGEIERIKAATNATFSSSTVANIALASVLAVIDEEEGEADQLMNWGRELLSDMEFAESEAEDQ